MANPFRRADRHGAPSIRPTPPESAERPMPGPGETIEGAGNRVGAPPSAERPMGPPPAPEIETRDLPVNRPVAPPSAETPMEPPSAPPPTNDKPPAKD